MADSNYAVQFTIAASLAAGFSGAFKSASGMMKGLTEESKALNEAQKKLKAEMDAVKSAMKDYSVPIEEAKEKMQDLRKAQLANYKDQAVASGQGIMQGAGKVAVAAGMATMFAEPIRDAMRFESAMADVRKVVDGLDDAQAFKGMSEDILKMSTEIPMTAEAIASIVAAGGQSGIAKSELLDFTKSAAKMGIAFDITAEEAGDMMAKWRTAFKMGQNDVVDLADKINYLGNTTAASAPLISDVVTRIGPLGEVGGVASGEIAALGASIVGVGVPSEVAATGIKNLILGMTAGEGATKSQAGAFLALGLDATEMAKRMQTDAKGAILDVMKALKNLEPHTQASVLGDLFGKESIAAIAPLLSNLENLESNFDKVASKASYAGSMEAEYASRCETAENSTQLFQNAVEYASTSMGQAFLPILKDVEKEFIPLVSETAKWVKENEGLVITIGGAVAGFIGLYVAVGVIQMLMNTYNGIMAISRGIITACTIAINSQKAAWIGQKIASIGAGLAQVAYFTILMTLRGAMMIATAAQWAFNAALSANPIGLVILAIAALIAIGVALYTYWDEVKAWFVLLWNDPSAAIDKFYQFVVDKFTALKDWLSGIWDGIKSIFSSPITAEVNSVKSGDVVPGVPDASMPAFAVGGIVNRPTIAMVGEGGDEEYIIPINGSHRARQLWQSAGQKLGLMGAGSESNQNSFGAMANQLTKSVAHNSVDSTVNSSAQFVYSPNITVTGQIDEQMLRRTLSNGFDDFVERINQWQHQKRRLEFE